MGTSSTLLSGVLAWSKSEFSRAKTGLDGKGSPGIASLEQDSEGDPARAIYATPLALPRTSSSILECVWPCVRWRIWESGTCHNRVGSSSQFTSSRLSGVRSMPGPAAEEASDFSIRL
ncbi:hypothetical protein OE88DRAFT_1661626 [Heliocybe sulcata]|uniref:Uncharacterized protein n=1 Tax=Heliocybe sulcata TaxID=5364 RepID=A0A5C3MX32_9AGAM|nr:hypothetical protein OE88DRAFT_1661626 [Heliocybe sulcata]